MDKKTALARYGEPKKDLQGNLICGVLKTSNRPCAEPAGFDTDHLGFGPCSQHETVLDGIKMTQTYSGYRTFIRSPQLAAILELEQSLDEIDSIDEEIVLLRSLIKLQSAEVGLTLRTTDDGVLETAYAPDEGTLGYMALNSQTEVVMSNIQRLSHLILTKHKIQNMTSQLIPRSVVERWVERVTLTLQTHLKNYCTNCDYEHGMQDKVSKALKKIGGIK